MNKFLIDLQTFAKFNLWVNVDGNGKDFLDGKASFFVVHENFYLMLDVCMEIGKNGY